MTLRWCKRSLTSKKKGCKGLGHLFGLFVILSTFYFVKRSVFFTSMLPQPQFQLYEPPTSICESTQDFKTVDEVPIRTTLLMVDFLLYHVGRNKKILEIGSRHGDIAACLSHYSASVTVVENKENYCTAISSRGITVICEDFTKLPSKKIPQVDAIFWWIGKLEIDVKILNHLNKIYQSSVEVPRILVNFDFKQKNEYENLLYLNTKFQSKKLGILPYVESQSRELAKTAKHGRRFSGVLHISEFFIGNSNSNTQLTLAPTSGKKVAGMDLGLDRSICNLIKSFKPMDEVPIRSTLRMVDSLLHHIGTQKRILVIGSRNGDIPVCLSSLSKNVSVVEKKKEYCDTLQIRGLNVICADFLQLSEHDFPKQLDAIFWFVGSKELDLNFVTKIKNYYTVHKKRIKKLPRVLVGYDSAQPNEYETMVYFEEKKLATRLSNVFYMEKQSDPYVIAKWGWRAQGVHHILEYKII